MQCSFFKVLKRFTDLFGKNSDNPFILKIVSDFFCYFHTQPIFAQLHIFF